MQIPSAWDRAVPDEPRLVEIRSMLLSGDATILGQPHGGFVVAPDRSLAGVVGHPAGDVTRQLLGLLNPGAELLAIRDSLQDVMSLVPGARPRRAVIHRSATELPGAPEADIEVLAVDRVLLDSLPRELAEEADGATLASVKWLDGEAVSMCTARWFTETLWDVGVDTLPEHRRRGHARDCFSALAERIGTERGLRPVWGALEDNIASLRMAVSLGFFPDSELWVVELPS